MLVNDIAVETSIQLVILFRREFRRLQAILDKSSSTANYSDRPTQLWEVKNIREQDVPTAISNVPYTIERIHIMTALISLNSVLQYHWFIHWKAGADDVIITRASG